MIWLLSLFSEKYLTLALRRKGWVNLTISDDNTRVCAALVNVKFEAKLQRLAIESNDGTDSANQPTEPTGD